MLQLSVKCSTELVNIKLLALPSISHVAVTASVLSYTLLSHRAVCQHCCHIHFVRHWSRNL